MTPRRARLLTKRFRNADEGPQRGITPRRRSAVRFLPVVGR